MRRLKLQLIRPDHQVYLLAHVLLFIGGLLIVQIGGPIWIAVGTSVSATGICGWAIFFWIRLSEEAAQGMNRIRQIGLIDAFPARSVPIRSEYESRFNAARRGIDFLGFGLRALREDFGSDFARWLEGIPIRILLVDPQAPHPGWHYVSQRDIEESNSPGSIEQDVQQFLQFLTPIKNLYPDRLQVRLYSCLPALNVCRIDDEIFWGPYVLGVQSRNTPTFLTGRFGVLHNLLEAHYESVFSDQFSRDAYTHGLNGFVPVVGQQTASS
jgi:hypothetical protein